MPARYLATLVLALAPIVASAQGAAVDEALAYFSRNAARYGLTAADLADLAVTDAMTSRRSGATHVYLRQRVGELEVVGTEMTVGVDRRNHVFHTAGEFATALGARVGASTPALTAPAAAEALARDAGLTPTGGFAVVESHGGPSREVVLSDGGVALEPPSARLVYLLTADGTPRLVWHVGLYERGAQHYWDGYVDASNGAVLRRDDLVEHCEFGPAAWHAHAAGAPHASAGAALAPLARPGGGASYRVYALPVESPNHTTPLPPADARTLETGVEDPAASPFGWHDTNGAAGAEFTVTRGNNVHAYTDVNADDNPDAGSSPDGGAGLTFDFPLDLSQPPSAYRPAAVTNLFYWNNVIHDVLHRYGFDEAGGNFQVNNYGNGGAGNDDVRAEAQDGSGTNNANFFTPVDGQRPVMQMYVGTGPNPDVDGDLDNGVITHEYGHGISNRLVGGPSNVSCLQNGEQMGEGWSDYYGLMLTMEPGDQGEDKRGFGTYLFGQPPNGPGIRQAPYSTDFALNSLTYADSRTAIVPHGVGAVWATALWEVTWDLIEAFGVSPDVWDAEGTAGNQIALNLVTEGLKLTPCGPGFVDGRDAVLAADLVLYGGAHTDLLWEAFARRGLGASADQGASTTNADNVEAFDLPEEVPPAPVTDLAVVPNGDYVTLTFTATGDDGAVGTAERYDVRHDDQPILTDAQFEAATEAANEPAPQEAGDGEAVIVEVLAFETTYHFALKVTDEWGNTSALSNPASTTTLGPPVLADLVPSISVNVPDGGTATFDLALSNTGESDLRYEVLFTDTTPRPGFDAGREADGSAPLFGRGGPDAFNYVWIDSNEPGGPTYVWEDISGVGTALSLGDDAAQQVTLPFPFEFYGVAKTSARVSSNGFLTFNLANATDAANEPIPEADPPNNVVAGFWDDLDPSAGGTVHYLGDAAAGRFTVQYTDVPRADDSGSRVTFQIVLMADGAIEYYYHTMAGGLTSATVGIENADGTVGLPVVYNAPYLEDELAVRIARLWVRAEPRTGQFPAGASETVTLTFDAAGFAPGTYTADLLVATNEPGGEPAVVPVVMAIGPVANEPDVLDFEGTHLLSPVAPNPAAGPAAFTLAVREGQHVAVSVYDALGRRVAVLHEGALAAGVRHAFGVSGGSLAAGAYVVRVEGEHFADTRRLTIVR